MNEFTLVGIILLVFIIIVISTLFACMEISDEFDIEVLPIYLSLMLLYIILTLFILGQVPYMITLFLFIYGGIILYGLYLNFKNK